MSGQANARKNFRWALELDGANQFLFQEVETPTVEWQEILHGAPANIPDVKTPGKMIVGDLVLKKLKPAGVPDTWAWDWFGAAMVGVANDFRKTGFLVDLDPAGLASVEKYYLGNIWPKKIEDSTRQAKSQDADNLIQTVTFSCQMFFPKESPQLQALLSGSAALAGGLSFATGFNQ